MLRCFRSVIETVLCSPNYKGDELERAIQESTLTITANGFLTAEADLIRGLQWIEEVKSRILDFGRHGPDSQRIREAHRNVASFVLDVASQSARGHYERAVEDAIWALDGEPSSQFALLRKTLDLDQPLTCMRVAVRLRSQYRLEDEWNRRGQCLCRLLGYSAMLRQKGSSERRWVEEQVVESLDADLAQALAKAHRWMYGAGELAAANALSLWRADFAGHRERTPDPASAPLVALNFSLFGRL